VPVSIPFATLFSDKWHEVLYCPPLHILRHNYLPATRELTPPDYREVMKVFADKLLEFSPTGVLVDFRSFHYVISAGEQEWTRSFMREVVPFKNNRKLAAIQGTDFLPQLSVEQTFPETSQLLVQIAYFQDEKESLFWLTSPF